MSADLRARLVGVAREWQKQYGVAPAITSALSEYDAAMLVGCTEEEYSLCTRAQTAVQRGHDFTYGGARYQVKANRPSGKPGSFVTLVAKPKKYEWEYLVWILYDNGYVIQEAWLWEVGPFKAAFDAVPRLAPKHMRQGKRIA